MLWHTTALYCTTLTVLHNVAVYCTTLQCNGKHFTLFKALHCCTTLQFTSLQTIFFVIMPRRTIKAGFEENPNYPNFYSIKKCFPLNSVMVDFHWPNTFFLFISNSLQILPYNPLKAMEKFDLGFPTGLLRIISYTNDFLRKIIKCVVLQKLY